MDVCLIPHLWGIHRKNTGLPVDFDSWQSTKQKRNKILNQSMQLATRLEAAGYPAITSKKLSFVGAITGHIEAAAAFRPICFLPSVAKQKRGAMLRDLTYWQKNTPSGRWLRYLVITNGQLVRIDKLGSNIRSFNRKISKWAHEAKERYSIDVVFRGLEFPFKSDSRAHLHANILYMPRARLSQEQFSEFLEFTHNYFGTVLHDAGRLKEPREAIKYPFKPNDLNDAKPEDLRTIAEQVFGQRIIEALGTFREWRSEIKENQLRTVYDNGTVVLARSYKRERIQSEDTVLPKSNRLVGIMPPMAHGLAFQEPVLIIEGDVQTVFENDESLRFTCLEFKCWWRENGGPDVRFNLDNRSLSVQTEIDLDTSIKSDLNLAGFG